MATRNIKIYLHKPLNAEWDELGERLRTLQYQFAKIMNYGITQFWLWQVEKEAFKEKTGKYPTSKELPNPANDNSLPIKKYIKNNFPEFPSYCETPVSQTLRSNWASDCKNVFYCHNKSLSTYKIGFPILCNNQQYTISWKKNYGYILTITLASMKYEGTRRFEIQLKTKMMQKHQKQILDQIISKKYKAGELKIKQDKKTKQWFVFLAYTFDPEKLILNPEIICGINFGMSVPFNCALNNSNHRLIAGDGGQIEKFRTQIANRKKELLSQIKFSTPPGKGRKHILRPIEKLKQKNTNFRDSKYHLYTKKIIDFCIKNNAGTIQVQYLSQLDREEKSDYFLKKWALHGLYEKLEYKAAEANIKIQKIDPQYTNLRCCKCGHISRENNKKTRFKCVICNYEANIDYNTACNISLHNIENRIEVTLNEKK